jgi:hypothetical protein
VATKRGNELDGVIITNGVGADIYKVVCRINEVYDMEKVYYFGDRDRDLERAVLLTFPKISVENYGEKSLFGGERFKFNYLLGGLAVEILTEKGKALVLSPFENKMVEYFDLKDEYDLAVYFDTIESVSTAVDARKEISYRRNNILKDAESSGNTRVLLA